MLRKKYLCLAIALLTLSTASAFAEVSYDTSANPSDWWNGCSFFPGLPQATDVHRSTSNPITDVAVGLYLDGAERVNGFETTAVRN